MATEREWRVGQSMCVSERERENEKGEIKGERGAHREEGEVRDKEKDIEENRKREIERDRETGIKEVEEGKGIEEKR